VAAHDLNYVAEAGLLSLAVDAQGTPAMTPTPLSDIGGGSYPAVINILLALVERQQTGRGRHLDVSMSDNVFPFMYWALGSAFAGRLPQPGQELVTGGSPRYRIYGTRDGRFVAAAPIEDRFWTKFCEIVGVPETADAQTVEARLAQESCVLAGEVRRPRRLLFDRRLVEEASARSAGGGARDLLQTVEADGVGFRRCRFRSWRLIGNRLRRGRVPSWGPGIKRGFEVTNPQLPVRAVQGSSHGRHAHG